MRMLMTYADNDGVTKCALIDFPEAEDSDDAVMQIPDIIAETPDINDASNITFAEVPDDYRPGVYDANGDEIAMQFITR